MKTWVHAKGKPGVTLRFGLEIGHLKCCCNLEHTWHAAKHWPLLGAGIHAWVFCLSPSFWTDPCSQWWQFQTCLIAPKCCCLIGSGVGLQGADQVPLLLLLPSQYQRPSLDPPGSPRHISTLQTNSPMTTVMPKDVLASPHQFRLTISWFFRRTSFRSWCRRKWTHERSCWADGRTCNLAQGEAKLCEKIEIEWRKGLMRGKIQDICTSFPWRLAALCAEKDAPAGCGRVFVLLVIC